MTETNWNVILIEGKLEVWCYDKYDLCCDAHLRIRLCCLLDEDLEPDHPQYIPF